MVDIDKVHYMHEIKLLKRKLKKLENLIEEKKKKYVKKV